MRKKKTATGTIPVCSYCKNSGNGVQFKMFGTTYGFGTFCVECEDTVTPELLEACKFAADHVQVIEVGI